MKGEFHRGTAGIWEITQKGETRLIRQPVSPPPSYPFVFENGRVIRKGEPPPPPPSEADKLAEEIKSLLEQLVELAKKGTEEPALSHDDVVGKVKEIGQMLGKSTEPVPQAEYRHDCVWRPNRWANPELVWEVCDKGVLEKDLVSLSWADTAWKAKGILVLFGEENFRKAQERFAHLSQLSLIKAEDLAQLHRMLKAGNTAVLETIFGT